MNSESTEEDEAELEQQALYAQIETPCEVELAMSPRSSPMAQVLRARQLQQETSATFVQAAWRGYTDRRRFASGMVAKPEPATPSIVNPKETPHANRWGLARSKLFQKDSRERDRWVDVLRLSGTLKTNHVFSAEVKQYEYHDFKPKRFIAKGNRRCAAAWPALSCDDALRETLSVPRRFWARFPCGVEK